MKVSVIIPSRLQVNPLSESRKLYLDRAIMSVHRQTADVDMEIIVGIDKPGLMDRFADLIKLRSRIEKRFREPSRLFPLSFVEGGKSQASAVNAAVKSATGDVIAILEDDDIWYPRKLEVQLPLLERYELVTCTQREIDDSLEGNFVRFNDFATPSGWIMLRILWEELGGFSTSMKFHVDTDFLGKINAKKIKRAHVVHDGAASPWLENIKKHSDIITHPLAQDPLVCRLINPAGGMSTIRSSAEVGAISLDEHARMIAKYGEVPW